MSESNRETTRNQPEHSPASAPATTTLTDQASTEPDVIYCVNHPNVETLLRCNRCGRPICLKCAELTDVGYRCKECIRGVQDKYFNAQPGDNFIAFGVSLAVTAVAVPLLGIILGMVLGRLWFIGIILAFVMGSAAGGILVQIVRTAVSKRRGRYLRHYALAGVISGVLLGSFGGAALLGFSAIALLTNLPLLVFTFLAAAAANRLLR